MIWVIQSLFSAVFLAARSIYDKHMLHAAKLSAAELSIYRYTPIALITLPLAIYGMEYTALNNPAFLWPMIANITLNTINMLVYVRIVRNNDVSLMFGIQSLEPLLVAVIAFFLVGDTLSWLGVSSIFIIVSGCFLLQKSRDLECMQKHWRHSPWLWVLIYMTLAATATSFSRMALQSGEVLMYIGGRYSVMTLIYAAVFFFFRPKNEPRPSLKWKYFGTGILSCAAVFLEMSALQVAKAAYVESLRRSSMFFALAFESLLFKKPWNTRRFLASLLLFSGIGLLVFSLTLGI